MKLKNNADLTALLHAVHACERDVSFCTPEGDRLNLKSALSEYVFSAMTLNASLLAQGHLEADACDLPRLLPYVVEETYVP